MGFGSHYEPFVNESMNTFAVANSGMTETDYKLLSNVFRDNAMSVFHVAEPTHSRPETLFESGSRLKKMCLAVQKEIPKTVSVTASLLTPQGATGQVAAPASRAAAACSCTRT